MKIEKGNEKNYFEIVEMESRRDNFAMESPFMAFETEKTIAFELFNERMSFVFLIELRICGQYFSDHVRF